jgi:hypothetical protein
VHGNATRVNWEEVCPKNEGDEIYILGNPPYLGSRNQEKSHKDDMEFVFIKDYKSLDYIACWFYLGSQYIRGINAKLAFVSTNSISQGEQVALTWQRVLKDDLEICFAHQSFKWQNNAKANAGVTVVVIGLANISKNKKYLYNQNIKHQVENINAYLTSSKQIYITRRSKPISKLTPIVFGNMPNDGGNLLFTLDEKDKLLNSYPFVKQFIKKFMGGREFLNGGDRWCLVVPDEDLELVQNVDEIQKRYKKIAEIRADSTEKSTREMAEFPNRFYFFSHKNTQSIIVPATTSENRTYIPIGFLDENTVIT